LRVIVGYYSGIPGNDWQWVYQYNTVYKQDLNQGAGGNYIYIAYSKADFDPWDRVASK